MAKGQLLKGLQQKIAITSSAERQSFSPEETQKVSNILHTEDDIKDSYCGAGFFKPKWLQRLATKEVYILIFSLGGTAQGMFFTYTVSVLSTIEKRFQLTSKETGAFLSGNDISQIMLAAFLGYFGSYGHRPRWLGFGMLLAAISCFATAIPHFIYGPGEDAINLSMLDSSAIGMDGMAMGNRTDHTSSEEGKQELCYFHPETCGEGDEAGDSYTGPVILFFFSQFFVGIASALCFSIGITYIDDNINKKSYPLYYSVVYVLRLFGPISGFVVGGKCLSMWIDPIQEPNLTKDDPRWYGAWWIGYLIVGGSLLLPGCLMMLFPKKLPATLNREVKKVLRQAEKDEQEGLNRGVEHFVSLEKSKRDTREKPNLKNLPKALRRLFTNKIWLALMFRTIVELFAASAYFTFKPKYFESQFRKSTSEASYYIGFIAITSLVIGPSISGAVIRFVHPRPRLVAAYSLFITLLACCFYMVEMTLGCPQLDIVGPFGSSTGPQCSADYGCSDKFAPMCSEDGSTLFYSPCFAGCTASNTSVSPMVYSDCRCISNSSASEIERNFSSGVLDYQATSPPPPLYGQGVSGLCEVPCDNFPYYIALQIICRTLEASSYIGGNLLYLRCVADEDKSLALGLLTVCMSFFSFIPAPIAMGAIIDSACLVWDETCGNHGNCWFYDADKFRILIHSVPGALLLLSSLGNMVVLYYSDQLDLYGNREDAVAEDNTQPETEELNDLNTREERGNETPETEEMLVDKS